MTDSHIPEAPTAHESVADNRPEVVRQRVERERAQEASDLARLAIEDDPEFGRF